MSYESFIEVCKIKELTILYNIANTDKTRLGYIYELFTYDGFHHYTCFIEDINDIKDFESKYMKL